MEWTFYPKRGCLLRPVRRTHSKKVYYPQNKAFGEAIPAGGRVRWHCGLESWCSEGSDVHGLVMYGLNFPPGSDEGGAEGKGSGGVGGVNRHQKWNQTSYYSQAPLLAATPNIRVQNFQEQRSWYIFQEWGCMSNGSHCVSRESRMDQSQRHCNMALKPPHIYVKQDAMGVLVSRAYCL